jgi:uncharacterized protein (TIGR00730 family)
MKSVCVFCGANPGNDPRFAQAAEALGLALAARGATVVYGGASVGLMATIADAALNAGGHVVGVIPRSLMAKEVAHKGLTELHVVETMHQRKALMELRSEAFVALPGGYGTLDELCEILTWAQLRIHRKPVAIFNVGGYFDRLLEFFDQAVAAGMLRPEHRRMLLVGNTAAEVLEALDRYVPPTVEKWTHRPGAE